MFSINRVLEAIRDSRGVGINLMRIGIAVVFIWIGAIKLTPYEADSITPFVAHSPVMSFFYKHPDQYKAHMTKEGELVPAQRAWQEANNTYRFADGLGTVELFIGFTTLAGLFDKRIGLVGGALAFLTPFVTLSFLFTTPEAWVPNLGDAQHGFPYIAGPGRLVLKDVCILAGGLLVMSDSAASILADRSRKALGMAPKAVAGTASAGSPARA
jgi:reactive chlorine resistance protein C